MTAVVERVMDVERQRVVDVLSDGWTYPAWVVGASRMRAVDATWPAEGARLHHSVGAWPFLLDDTTSVVENVLEDRLVLEARAWPIGRARITFELEVVGAARTLVRMSEEVLDHLGLLLPEAVTDPPIGWRNTEVLRRLAALAERTRG